jgi:hypothetical protein
VRSIGISELYLPLAVYPATFMGALRIPKIHHFLFTTVNDPPP